MVLQPFLIGPLEEGKQNNLEPFYLPENAYFDLEDVYIWRGRLRKRFGYALIGNSDLNSRLRINLGNTSGTGGIGDTVPGTVFKVGQMFSIGEEIFTVKILGTPAEMLITGASTLATYNTTTGAFVIAGAAINTPCYFYPAEPVMGLRTRETGSINQEKVIAFDTQFSYSRVGDGWERLGTAIWTGSDSKFFWSTNYRGANTYEKFFYVVNFNEADNIKYLPEGSSTWTNFRPKLTDFGADRFLETARIITHFKDRLIAFNTVEEVGGVKRSFPNRCRFSQSGTPIDVDKSWLDNVAGRGGFINAPTQEAIITVERIKDKLIVYFERSTWELIYTGNKAIPFRWQQINNQLGCESTFSVIGFDTSALGVGNVGIHGCNGINVERIDEKIPDEVFKIHNGNNGPERVYGIRDFYNETVYWTFPDSSSNPKYPTRIFLYNYKNNTWAIFNDSFTCFGYFQKTSDLKWETVQDTYPTWEEWNNPWGSPLFQSSFPSIAAGNQEGFVFIIDNGISSNSQSLYITDMNPSTKELTIINHNLRNGDYVLIEEAQGITSLNSIIVKVDDASATNIIVIDTEFEGTYTGGGKISRVSNIKITTAQFNPGTAVGKKFIIPFIDLLLNRTTNGEISIDYLINTSSGATIQNKTENNVLLGSNILFTKSEETQIGEIEQQQIWHRFYPQAESQFLQLSFFMSENQMKNPSVARSDFELHAMILYLEEKGRIIG